MAGQDPPGTRLDHDRAVEAVRLDRAAHRRVLAPARVVRVVEQFGEIGGWVVSLRLDGHAAQCATRSAEAFGGRERGPPANPATAAYSPRQDEGPAPGVSGTGPLVEGRSGLGSAAGPSGLPRPLAKPAVDRRASPPRTVGRARSVGRRKVAVALVLAERRDGDPGLRVDLGVAEEVFARVALRAAVGRAGMPEAARRDVTRDRDARHDGVARRAHPTGQSLPRYTSPSTYVIMSPPGARIA